MNRLVIGGRMKKFVYEKKQSTAETCQCQKLTVKWAWAGKEIHVK
jgi:hypothetical protein